MRLLRYFIFACAVTTWTAALAWAGDCSASGGCPMSAAACKSATASGACTAAMRAACAKHGASATTAMAAGKGCPMHGASAAAAGCSAHAAAMHPACAVCNDDAECEEDVRALGAHTQIVQLRNGAMIVYTVDNPASVHALQAAVARHNNRVVAALGGKTDASLCADCKQLRGAMESGKFTREVVNLEHGCQILMTSSDPSIVQRIHASTSPAMPARAGS